MQSKRPKNKTSGQLADIRVGTDKGSLRLQFSTKVSQQFYGKRQAGISGYQCPCIGCSD
ncbi:hypothetical protein LC653_06015 [Nostoc sp. CHAB 5784]|uniref:hypothetical protein n=1 Tax=Nostoc mirabile TaxID=2907820 RepID=UPI001E47F666|nr:hypothetical protein [Nostoc mirabile]MCC5663500.1 hypothetical protein [Nostoc mirabile CHAB5784]